MTFYRINFIFYYIIENVDKARQSPQNTVKKYELDSVKTDFNKLQRDLSECKDKEDLSKIDDVRLTFEYRYLCFFFVDIGGIVDHHCLNFHFVIKVVSSLYCVMV
jgi:hypothetical protein